MVCVLCGGPMPDADSFAHSLSVECRRFTEERMQTAQCLSCGLPLDSQDDEDKPRYCQVCLALKEAEKPEVLGEESD